MNKSINSVAVNQIAHKNQTAEAVFTVLATRERNRTQTDLRRLRSEVVNEGFQVVPEEFMQMFEDMQKAGIGKLEKKPGKAPRFIWNYHLAEVGRIGCSAPQDPIKPPVPIKAKTETLAQGLVIRLGGGRSAKLSLPANMSPEDAVFLAKTILAEVG